MNLLNQKKQDGPRPSDSPTVRKDQPDDLLLYRGTPVGKIAKYVTFPAKDQTVWLFIAPNNELLQLRLLEPTKLTPGLSYTLQVASDDAERTVISVMCVMMMDWSIDPVINGYKLLNHGEVIGIVIDDPKKESMQIHTATPGINKNFEHVLRETANAVYHYCNLKSMH